MDATVGTTIDVLDPALWDDPYGALARARSGGPVARTPDGEPILLRYDDVDEALRHPGLATFSVQSLLDHNGIADGPLREWCDLLMLSLEGDDHARLRGLVSRAFTPRRVDAARAGARSFVRSLLASASVGSPTMRVARQPVTIGPVTLGAGEPVHLSLLAANRDPDRFDRADVLDVGRSDVRHVSFGYGVHHCIGAALARLELQEALAELVTSCREISLEIDAPVWVPYLQVRRVESLPLSFRRIAGA